MDLVVELLDTEGIYRSGVYSEYSVNGDTCAIGASAYSSGALWCLQDHFYNHTTFTHTGNEQCFLAEMQQTFGW